MELPVSLEKGSGGDRKSGKTTPTKADSFSGKIAIRANVEIGVRSKALEKEPTRTPDDYSRQNGVIGKTAVLKAAGISTHVASC